MSPSAGSVLVRTALGTLRMRKRSGDLSPKLRSVLFLVSGEVTLGELLDRAGALGPLLESQIRSLCDMGLVAIANAEAAAPVEPPKRPAAAPLKHLDLPPVAAAKISLLERLEACGCGEIEREDLLGARTLRELAERSRAVAIRLQDAGRLAAGEEFWSRAKEILVATRDFAATGGR